ncbi:unnamed protein product [Pleuronectes platessa]|uniref:Uncharacterized protein n=1 Tax=Pleuronectes platessa TaxID=8262 RepID=A0A9N7TYW7_PLEPL|nr:unnamed protein product [Pleuronectes platessa]
MKSARPSVRIQNSALWRGDLRGQAFQESCTHFKVFSVYAHPQDPCDPPTRWEGVEKHKHTETNPSCEISPSLNGVDLSGPLPFVPPLSSFSASLPGWSHWTGHTLAELFSLRLAVLFKPPSVSRITAESLSGSPSSALRSEGAFSDLVASRMLDSPP